ncbi:hypothetical protein [Xanthomarina gelatinilytica]|jgi:hypothetical protein
MKKVLYLILFFLALQAQAQKVTNKSFSSKGVSTLVINGDMVFKMHIETAKTQTISIQSLAEGEHSEEVVLITQIKSNTLYISSIYQPLFVADNDKLSAHKVLSVEYKLVIPEQLNLSISSSIASVFLFGNYNKVTTELMNGSFFAKSFKGDLLVNTIHGDIEVETHQATAEASSKHGKVDQAVLGNGNNQITLNSINGNIRISKSE